MTKRRMAIPEHVVFPTAPCCSPVPPVTARGVVHCSLLVSPVKSPVHTSNGSSRSATPPERKVEPTRRQRRKSLVITLSLTHSLNQSRRQHHPIMQLTRKPRCSWTVVWVRALVAAPLRLMISTVVTIAAS